MIRVYKSDTGQYVLVNEPTETVIIDDDLEAAFNKMQEFVRENHPELMKRLFEPFEAHKAKPTAVGFFSGMKPGLLVLIAGLPFLWLVILHFTISSIADDVVDFVRAKSVPAAEDVKRLQSDLLRLNEQVSRLGSDKQAAVVGPDQIRAETKPLVDGQALLRADIDRLRADMNSMNVTVGNLNNQLEAVRKSLQPNPAAPSAPK